MKKSLLFGVLATLGLLSAAPAALAQTQTIVNGGTYKLTHYDRVDPATKTPLCLDVDFDSKDAGASIGQFLDNGIDAQRFIFEQQTDGSYKLRHKGTVMYVQPVGLSSAANTKIEQNVASSSDAQRWVITDPGNNGRFKFTLKSTLGQTTPQVLEVGFGSDVPGARVNLFDDNGFEPAQRWLLTLVSTPTATRHATELELSARAYPNPASQGQRLTVQVEALAAGPADLDVLNALGQRVQSQRTALRAGSNLVSLSQSRLAAGVYVLRVRQGDFVQQTRLVQQ